MRRTVRIHVQGGHAAPRLLATLGGLAGVSFAGTGAHEGHLQVDDAADAQAAPAAPTLRCAGVMDDGGDRRLDRVDVLFADDDAVPWPFRGRRVSTAMPANCAPLALVDGERVLAATASGAVWAVRVLAGHAHFRSAMPLLEIPPGGSLSQVFGGASFLANLPLMQFLAQFDSTGLGARQPLRASFMFDDPNLHWPSYGYVNYARVLEKADAENFHVSFATIPLDAWYAHGETASRFRAHATRLSLLVHGNNHTRNELAREASPAGCAALLQQAQRRIGRLEARAGLSIDRVMVPPHGACSATMLAALPGEGYDGACISAGSLSAHNPGADWIPELGFRPAEQILGCPVMPRWALGNVEDAELLVAAWLGRPLILRGHHGDLRDGLDVLEGKARFINGLGDVRWLGNTALMRTSHRLNMVGSTAWLRVFARCVCASIPACATALVIEPADLDAVHERYLVSGLAADELVASPYRAIPLPARDKDLEVTIAWPPVAARSAPVVARGLHTASVARRLLTELRDRLMPLAS